MMDCHVQIEGFEGPLELLLDLIKKNQYDMENLPMSKITQDYMAQLSEMNENRYELTSNFLVMASQLLRIKSEMMIPMIVDDEDPRKQLVLDLIEYQRIKESEEMVREMQTLEEKYFKRTKPIRVKKTKSGSVEDLVSIYKNMLENKYATIKHNRFEEMIQELNRSEYSMADKIKSIEQRLLVHPLNIKKLFQSMKTREESVVTFSALLEIIHSQYGIIEFQNDELYIRLKGDHEYE